MGEELAVLSNDTLVHVAEQAEARVDAVVKIKQLALKVTNNQDWVDQDGKPYLMASGSEKIANLFNISWRIDEPIMDEEADGVITYTYKGYFSLAGRSIEVEGSRSSRDPFFKKFNYENGERVSEKPLDRRDLKMAAMTNLLGNGITRLLGIRNLTYEDLEEFTSIKRENVKGIKYKKTMQEPRAKTEKKKEKTPGTSNEVTTLVKDVGMRMGKKKDGSEYTLYTVKGKDADYKTFSETSAGIAKEAKEKNTFVLITFTTDKYGNNIETIEPFEQSREAGEGDS